jgi:hypothetical protein
LADLEQAFANYKIAADKTRNPKAQFSGMLKTVYRLLFVRRYIFLLFLQFLVPLFCCIDAISILVGFMYERGFGVFKNYHEAKRYYKVGGLPLCVFVCVFAFAFSYFFLSSFLASSVVLSVVIPILTL